MTATPLLRLYQLLWEEIKDKKYFPCLTFVTSTMEISGKITLAEEDLIDEHIVANELDLFTTEDSKAFVLRRIEELKTENQ